MQISGKWRMFWCFDEQIRIHHLHKKLFATQKKICLRHKKLTFLSHQKTFFAIQKKTYLLIWRKYKNFVSHLHCCLLAKMVRDSPSSCSKSPLEERFFFLFITTSKKGNISQQMVKDSCPLFDQKLWSIAKVTNWQIRNYLHLVLPGWRTAITFGIIVNIFAPV